MQESMNNFQDTNKRKHKIHDWKMQPNFLKIQATKCKINIINFLYTQNKKTKSSSNKNKP